MDRDDDTPSAEDAKQSAEDKIITIPLTRAAEKAFVSSALSKVQWHLDQAKKINDDLGLVVAGDYGYDLKPGLDAVRFAEDEEGKEISLLILRHSDISG